MNIVTIIIARGGSKGIPKKNIMNFCGSPLITWTIKQALLADKISDVWVSSDSEEILNISKKSGAKIILRPDNISGDKEPSESAWLHALNYIESNADIKEIDYILAPQVTSPLREPEDFTQAIDLLLNSEVDSLLAVSEIEDYFIWEKDASDQPQSINYDYHNRLPRQQIQKKYLENGSFYMFKPKLLRENNNRLGGKISLFKMDRYKMFQIDNLADIELCSVIMKGYDLNKI